MAPSNPQYIACLLNEKWLCLSTDRLSYNYLSLFVARFVNECLFQHSWNFDTVLMLLSLLEHSKAINNHMEHLNRHVYSDINGVEWQRQIVTHVTASDVFHVPGLVMCVLWTALSLFECVKRVAEDGRRFKPSDIGLRIYRYTPGFLDTDRLLTNPFQFIRHQSSC